MKLRQKLGEYQEIYYMIFILALAGMNAADIYSESSIYKYIFVFAAAFLLLKMAVTNFTLREILIMAVFTVLLGYNFVRNGEKTLVLVAMGIFGAKNVSLKKVFRCAFWLKAAVTVVKLTLAAVGVTENVSMLLPKGSEMLEIYCYGYGHPNSAFANIFSILLLAFFAYEERLKWYAYVIGTLIMLAAYKVFVCRTGLFAWLAFCLMMLGYQAARRLKWEKIYMAFFPIIPLILAILTFILPVRLRMGSEFAVTINYYMTGRVRLNEQALYSMEGVLWGNTPGKLIDSMYFHLLYNYGGILFALCLVAYCGGLWYCNKKNEHYGTIGLGIMAVYGFMELLPLSIPWNLSLLYLASILFRERRATNEQLQ